MKTRREQLVEKLGTAETMADIHRQSCEYCLDSIYSITAPTCFVAVDLNRRAREVSQQIDRLEQRYRIGR